MKELFSFTRYKDYLRHESGRTRGLLTALARAAGCQPAYLWRVLNEEVHLTPDHAFKISRHLQFDQLEQEYFLTMVEHERAGDVDFKRHLATKLDSLRKEHEDLRHAAQKPSSDATQKNFAYHAQWFIAACHFLTSRPKGVTAAEAASALGLPRAQIEQALGWLAANEYVKKQGNKFVFERGSGHIGKQDPILPFFHQNWRQIAVADSYNAETSGLHFTNLQMISNGDFQRLRQLLNDFIRQASAIANESPSEELMVFTCDLFLKTKEMA